MAGNAAGYLCLQVPGRVHLTIIPLLSQSESSQFSNSTSRFHRGGFAGPSGRIYIVQSLAFGFQAGPGVNVCRVGTLMAEPVANHCYIDTGRDKAYRRGMPKLVRFCPQDDTPGRAAEWNRYSSIRESTRSTAVRRDVGERSRVVRSAICSHRKKLRILPATVLSEIFVMSRCFI